MLNIFFVCSFVSCLALLTAGGQGTLASGGGVRNIVQKNNRKFGQDVGVAIILVTFTPCKYNFLSFV